ncbi:hypothetical protein AN639_03850 [Candidatus Epulonipiscium fishelsonii]|uniref:Uncharacterized protein n=1 Tax=Candidatus Epulonipiscium fishelsonii TaxID=77094 RepID=A0ACC8XAR9_9FIRM|nr:hypothetical protein AN396_08530 [Epulopiscium sp. SCG-B11WGA-EpuloA1]ONI41194.1 hypothetical protein AN639_03850 [Epulopiscium sp. SCG-B05WGA-EpuloA1]
MERLKNNKWFLAILIGMAGGLSFELAYLKYNYQPAMEVLMGLSSTEVGVLMSTYGFWAMILYGPSGIIADKFNNKFLIVSCMILTGMLGFVMALYPPYPVLLAIQVLFALTTVLFMWSATIKSVSILGSSEEQGALLGLSEGARGIGCLIAAMLALFIFNQSGAENNPNSLRFVLISYGVTMIILGVLCGIFLKNDEKKSKDAIEKNPDDKFTMKDVIYVLKLKTTWLCSLIILGVYIVYACLSYTSSYVIDIFGASMSMGILIGTIRNQVMRSLSPPIAGWVTQKTPLKSPTKILFIVGIINCIALLILVFGPNEASAFMPMLIVILTSAMCVYISRGMYWATVGEVNTPKKIVGTTVGVASVIGFLPDAFIYVIIGNWQDTLPPQQAYDNMWMMSVAGTILTVIASFLLLKEIKKITSK